MTQPANELAVREPSISLMLSGVLEKGVTNDNALALEKLFDLYERDQARIAKKDFTTAFVALQSELSGVQATCPVKDRSGNVMYNFAPFEDIMKEVQPILKKNGFAVSFSTRNDETRVVSICTLMHAGGHSQSSEFAARNQKGPPNASDAQADGAANTYARRFALCNALNIVVTHMDDDARAIGSPVTAEQAGELRRRAVALNIRGSFLEHARSDDFADIPSERFEELSAMLARKEAKAKPAPAKVEPYEEIDPQTGFPKF